MWSLISPRVKPISGSKNFRSSAQKDFFNTIDPTRTFDLIIVCVAGWDIRRTVGDASWVLACERGYGQADTDKRDKPRGGMIRITIAQRKPRHSGGP